MATDSKIKSSTVDPTETQLFSSLSREWWNIDGLMKPMHGINQLVVPYIKEVLSKKFGEDESQTTFLKDIQVLEVGCGGGILAEPLARTGCSVVGIDVNADLIEVAKEHAKLDTSLSNLTYILEDVEDHCNNNPQKYDAIVSNFVLEHINEVELFLTSCMACLKPGGSIFVSTLGQTWLGWLAGIILPEYILGKIPRGAHDWKKFVAIEDTEKMLATGNCKIQEGRGFMFSIFSDVWYWINNTDIFYIVHAVKD